MTAGLDEEALYAEVLAEHQKHPHGEMSEQKLRLHVALHVVVENQVRSAEPPFVVGTLDRLIDEGLERHAAVHAIAAIAAEEVFAVVRGGGTYDEARYAERLAGLSAR